MFSSINRHRGLTLLEVTLALAVAGIVVTGVFRIAMTSLELNTETRQLQERETTRQAFLDLLRREFRHLPPETQVALSRKSTRQGDVTTLALQEPGLAFAFSNAAGHQAVELATSSTGDSLDVHLRFVWADGTSRDLVLLREVTTLEWRCLDTGTGQWRDEWIPGGVRPTLLELQLGFDGDLPERHLLWIPKLVPSALRLEPLQPEPTPAPQP